MRFRASYFFIELLILIYIMSIWQSPISIFKRLCQYGIRINLLIFEKIKGDYKIIGTI